MQLCLGEQLLKRCKNYFLFARMRGTANPKQLVVRHKSKRTALRRRQIIFEIAQDSQTFLGKAKCGHFFTILLSLHGKQIKAAKHGFAEKGKAAVGGKRF